MSDLLKQHKEKFKNFSFKKKLQVIVTFSAMMLLFLTCIGWTLASEPISSLNNYELTNKPAPVWAKSFSINHGKAVYYRDLPSSERPLKKYALISLFFLLYIILLKLIHSKESAGNDN